MLRRETKHGLQYNTLRIHEMKCKTMATKNYMVDPCQELDHSHEQTQCVSMSHDT